MSDPQPAPDVPESVLAALKNAGYGSLRVHRQEIAASPDLRDDQASDYKGTDPNVEIVVVFDLTTDPVFIGRWSSGWTQPAAPHVAYIELFDTRIRLMKDASAVFYSNVLFVPG